MPLDGMKHRGRRGALRRIGIRRRIRGLVPPPVRHADLAVFRAVARTELPFVGRALPVLSRAANHSRLWLAIAGGLLLHGSRPSRRAALRGMASIAVTSAVTNLPAKLLTARARPEIDGVPEIRRLAHVPTSTSFPSGHSASAFAFATALAAERPRMRTPITALAATVAFSRIYTGVHYPGDVLAGIAMGTGIARATTRVWPLIDPTPARAQRVATASDVVEADGAGLVVVVNTGAGNALAPERIAELHAMLPRAQILEAGPDEGLSTVLHRAARGARVLGIAGGDGSVNAGAAVAAEFGIPLVVIPTGTLNHLATDLGVEGVASAAQAVRHGDVIAMDVGEIADRLFLNAAGVGAYPQLVASRERLEPRVGKWPAVAWSLLRILVEGAPFPIEIDDQPRLVWSLFIGNGRFRAAGISPTRRERLDEGVLDVRLVNAELPWSRTRMLASMLRGRPASSSVYEHWTTSELKIRSMRGRLRLARDGESWRGPDRVTVRVRHRALLVLQGDAGDGG